MVQTVYSRKEMEQLEKLARRAAGIPEAKTALELVETHLPAALEMVAQLSRQCADPKIRLDACKTLISLGEIARQEKEKREELYYAGNPEALKQLSLLQDANELRQAALQLFAEQRINRVDLNDVLRAIDDEKDRRIKALAEENEQLTRTIEGEEPAKPTKPIKQIINGAATHVATNGASH
jgi:hypothetical protein